MIETEQTALVRAPIDDIWSFVRDIERWAQIMPGHRECAILDENRSRWLLKVGVGGLVRTVTVNVTVDAWEGPGEVRFSYALEGDPVQGSGTYRARALGPAETEIALAVQVVGQGPVAPMWEAMGRPVLPSFARAFAEQLRDDIEAALAVEPSTPVARATPVDRLLGWLRSLWKRLTGRV